MSDPYCRIHNCNHCRQCMFDKHAERIIKAQEKQTAEIVMALARQGEMDRKSKATECCKPVRRKADWPLVVAQIISVTVLIAAVVIVKT